jgi:Cys-rich protein (TIGR01571 family)
MVCWACWLTPVALGQVMTRMKMNAAAEVNAGNEDYANTLSILVTISIVTWIIVFSFSVWLPSVAWLPLAAAGVYFIVIGTKTRKSMRKKFNIEGSGCADCCLFFWCTHCISDG